MKCPKCDTVNPSDSKFCKECATPLPSLENISASPTKTLETPFKELTRGTTFAGRYEIIDRLASGGMGKVYRVFDKEIKEKINTDFNEHFPTLSTDGKYLFFISDRVADKYKSKESLNPEELKEMEENPQNGNSDICWLSLEIKDKLKM